LFTGGRFLPGAANSVYQEVNFLSPGHMNVPHDHHGCVLLTKTPGQRATQHPTTPGNDSHFSGEIKWSI
jgi:hypothetical protein